MLVRCRLNRLSRIDLATGEPIRRYEHERPGDLIHLDVKDLRKAPTAAGGATSVASRAVRTDSPPLNAPAIFARNGMGL